LALWVRAAFLVRLTMLCKEIVCDQAIFVGVVARG
jgi:hypothetical protein